MSEGLNRVMMIGNLCADPELKHGQSGMAVMRLRVACTEKWMKDGERQERTEFITAVFFGKRAEGLSRHLSKGERVYVEGRLQTREWEKDGVKRYTTEVVGTQLLFLGGGKRDGERQQRSDTGGQQKSSAGSGNNGGTPRDFPADDFGDDEIPF